MKNGKLVFIKGNRVSVIENDKPFALLQKIKKQIKNNPEYFGGKLKIRYLFN